MMLLWQQELLHHLYNIK